MSDSVGAAHFYVEDLAESLEVTDVKSMTKLELVKQVEVWRNSANLAKSHLEECLQY